MNNEIIRENFILHTDKVFIGDICYALDEEIYFDWADNHNGKKGLIMTKDNIVCAVVGGTYGGDGSYKGDNGKEFSVDAGVIGVTDLNYHNGTYENIMRELGDIVEIPDEYVKVNFTDEEGYFTISLKDKNGKDFYYVEIPTQPGYNDDEYLENNDEWNNWNNYDDEDEDDYPKYEDA